MCFVGVDGVFVFENVCLVLEFESIGGWVEFLVFFLECEEVWLYIDVWVRIRNGIVVWVEFWIDLEYIERFLILCKIFGLILN